MNLVNLIGEDTTAVIDNDNVSFLADGKKIGEMHPSDVMEQALLLLGIKIEYV